MNMILPTLAILFPLSALGTPMTEALQQMDQRWQELIKHPVPERKEHLAKVLHDTEVLIDEFPDQAEFHAWQGIVLVEQVFTQPRGDAQRQAAQARALLIRAVNLDDSVLAGAGHLGLGRLYQHAPLWPFGFGDARKAQAHFMRALAINPQNADAHFHYAQFLKAEGDMTGARRHLARAETAFRAEVWPNAVTWDDIVAAQARFYSATTR